MSPRIVEDVRLEMEEKHVTVERMEKVLVPVEKFVQVVDTGIQHSPETM